MDWWAANADGVTRDTPPIRKEVSQDAFTACNDPDVGRYCHGIFCRSSVYDDSSGPARRKNHDHSFRFTDYRQQGWHRCCAKARPDLRDALHRLALRGRQEGQEIRQLRRPQRAVRISDRTTQGDRGLGRRRCLHESRWQTHADHSARAGLRRPRRRRRYSPERDADVRRRIAGCEGLVRAKKKTGTMNGLFFSSPASHQSSTSVDQSVLFAAAAALCWASHKSIKCSPADWFVMTEICSVRPTI